MIRRFFIVCCVILPFAVSMRAEETDSLSVNRSLEELVVTGTRSETDVRHLSQTVSVIDRKEIE